MQPDFCLRGPSDAPGRPASQQRCPVAPEIAATCVSVTTRTLRASFVGFDGAAEVVGVFSVRCATNSSGVLRKGVRATIASDATRFEGIDHAFPPVRYR